MRTCTTAAAAALLATCAAAPAMAQTEITWWHAMGGELGQKLEEIAAGFNASQSDYKVVPVFKGTYRRDDDRRHRRLPRRRAARHRPGLRGRHRHDDGGPGRGLSGLPADGGQRQAVRPGGLSSPRWSATTPTPTATCCPCRSTPRRRSSTTTRTSSRKPASTRETPPATWAELEVDVAEDHGHRRGALRLHHRLVSLGAARELLRLAQPAARHARRTALAAGTPSSSSTSHGAGQALGQPEEVAGRRHLRVWRPGPGADARAEVLRRGMRHLHELLGRACRRAWPTPDFERRHRRCCRTTTTSRARRRTRSSAAPRCGCCRASRTTNIRGVAGFFEYLSQPEVQADWHQFSGYLPITKAAYDLGIEQGYYEKNPGRTSASSRSR